MMPGMGLVPPGGLPGFGGSSDSSGSSGGGSGGATPGRRRRRRGSAEGGESEGVHDRGGRRRRRDGGHGHGHGRRGRLIPEDQDVLPAHGNVDGEVVVRGRPRRRRTVSLTHL